MTYPKDKEDWLGWFAREKKFRCVEQALVFVLRKGNNSSTRQREKEIASYILAFQRFTTTTRYCTKLPTIRPFLLLQDTRTSLRRVKLVVTVTNQTSNYL